MANSNLVGPNTTRSAWDLTSPFIMIGNQASQKHQQANVKTYQTFTETGRACFSRTSETPIVRGSRPGEDRPLQPSGSPG